MNMEKHIFFRSSGFKLFTNVDRLVFINYKLLMKTLSSFEGFEKTSILHVPIS